MAAVAAVVPVTPQPADAGIRTEPGALRRPQVLLTLVVSTVGFDGISAVHSHPSTATSRRSPPTSPDSRATSPETRVQRDCNLGPAAPGRNGSPQLRICTTH